MNLHKSNSDNVLLAACTIGRVGAKEACSNAKQGVDGYEYFTVGDDDDSSDNTPPTYYKERFCKKSITQTQIDHPHAISIFRLNSNNYETTKALLEEFRELHANNIEWANNTQIGADGHLLAKIIPCDQISDKFKNPSNMYPNLSNDNSICDYVGSNGKQFAQEALLEWQSLCSIWPLNDDGSIPKCHGKMLSLFPRMKIPSLMILLSKACKYLDSGLCCRLSSCSGGCRVLLQTNEN